MEFIKECILLDDENKSLITVVDKDNITTPKMNLIDLDQSRVKVELDDLDYFKFEEPREGISNLEETPKIKTETLDELVCLKSTDSCELREGLEKISTKTELLAEEYHIPFKEEISPFKEKISEDPISFTEKQYHGGHHIIKQNISSKKSRNHQGILKYKKLCNQCRLCGLVFLCPPEYFWFHWLCYHSSAKYLKNTSVNKQGYFQKSFKKTKVYKNNRIKCNLSSTTFLCINKWKRNFSLYNKKKHKFARNLLECEICLQQFSHKGDLISHIRHHKVEKPFQCDICLKQFTKKGSLVIHMRCHTGEKSFQCEICLKPFVHKSHLTRHMRCHTGEKPFKCEVCSKQFSRKDYVTRHALSHQRETI